MKGFRVFLLVCVVTSLAWGEEVIPTGKTADYYRILLNRPRPGYLFDRFCNAWLEEHDLAQLKTFLSESDDTSAKLLQAFLYALCCFGVGGV